MQSGIRRFEVGGERLKGLGIGIVVVVNTFAGAVVGGVLVSAALVPRLGIVAAWCCPASCCGGGGGGTVSTPRSQQPRHLQLHRLR